MGHDLGADPAKLHLPVEGRGASGQVPYDLLIVGSSPLGLLEAVSLAAMGKSVCLVEQEDRIGGAWSTEDCLGLRGIETSPHVFLPDPAAYDVLDQRLNAGFEPLSIQPVVMVRRERGLFSRASIPVTDRARAAVAMTLATCWDRKGRWAGRRLVDSVLYLTKRLKDISRQPRICPARYPVRGLTPWLRTAQQTLEDTGVNLRVGTRITSLRRSAGGVQAVTPWGETIQARKVALPVHAWFDDVTNGQRQAVLDYKASYSNHYTYVVRGTPPAGFVQTVGYSDIMLINDVTDYAEDMAKVYPGCRLITLRSKARRQAHGADPAHYFELLKTMGYVKPDAVMEHVHVRALEVRKMRGSTIRDIEATLGDAVTFLISGDLSIMSSIARYHTGRT